MLERLTQPGPVVIGVTLSLALMGCERAGERHRVVTETPSGQFTSPPAVEAAEQGHALVRVVNAIPDSDAIVVAGAQEIASDLPYGDATGYESVSADEEQFEVRNAMTGETMARYNQAVMEGQRYTLVLYQRDHEDPALGFPPAPTAEAGAEEPPRDPEPGAAGQPEQAPAEERPTEPPRADGKTAAIQLIRDDLNETPDQPRLRVFNAVPDASLDVAFQGEEARFENVGFEDDTRFEEVDATATTIEARSNGQVVASTPVTIQPGAYYTVIVAGATEPPQAPPEPRIDEGEREPRIEDEPAAGEAPREDRPAPRLSAQGLELIVITDWLEGAAVEDVPQPGPTE